MNTYTIEVCALGTGYEVTFFGSLDDRNPTVKCWVSEGFVTSRHGGADRRGFYRRMARSDNPLSRWSIAVEKARNTLANSKEQRA